MSLQFIAGAGGSGKSTYIYRKTIEESLQNSGRSFYVIVPEQYSMQAQGDLVRLHPNGCITNIDVLNFTRLSYRVFKETGFNCGPVLDDTGKVLVLEKIARDLAVRLSVLGSAMGKKGAVSLVKSLISELMQYRVEPETLVRLCEEGELSGFLKYKLADIRTIYGAFLTYTAGRYITSEEMPQILSERIAMTDFLKGADVVLDGFTGFVPAQTGVIEKLLELCNKVTVVLTMDTEGEAAEILRGKRSSISKSDLFRMSGETALKVMELARNAGTKILPPVFVEPLEQESRDLAFLSANIYRKKSRIFPGKGENIFVTMYDDPKEEMSGIAAAIGNLVRTKGYRYRDIAVITGDPGTYGDIAEEIFGECGIPHFIDRKKPVLPNPAVEFIRSAIGMMTDGFSYKSVFRYLRCGMTDFSREETDLLETYVLAAGIKGLKKYREEWTKPCRDCDEALLERINEIRGRFVSSVGAYADAMRTRMSTVEDKTRALYSLIEANHIQEKCVSLSDAFEKKGENALWREYAQIYRIIIDDLDKMTEILGAEKVSLKTYEQLTEAVFAERHLGLIPPGADRVTVGDVERTRLPGIRVLFLAGVNEGFIPAPVNRTSLLSAGDRDQILKNKVRLAPDEREELMRQRFYMYLTLQRPKDALYLSFALHDAASRTLMPSPLIGQIEKMFAGGVGSDKETFPLSESGPGKGNVPLSAAPLSAALTTARGREKMLTDGLNRMRSESCDNSFLQLCAWYAESPSEKHIYETAKAAFSASAPKSGLDAGMSVELYGKNVLFSPTRLERFAGCAFAHFLKYGLRLKDREIFEWNAMDRGSLVHLALQRYFELAKDGGFRADRSLTGRAYREALDAFADKILTDSRSTFAAKRLGELVEITVWALTEQIRRGDFVPAAAELPWQTSGVTGVIDRLDVCRRDGADYFRVIDYKTGSESLDLGRLIYGAKIQLPLYMKAASEISKKTGGTAEPAGIYYYNISEPVTETGVLDAEPDKRTLLKELRLTGLTREEPEILTLTDRELVPSSASDVVKVTLKRDGTCDARSEAAPYDDFELIIRYTDYIVNDMRTGILSGAAAISPLTDGQNSACTWCEFKSVCRFDRRVPGYKERLCEKRNRNEALLEMVRILNEAGSSPV